MDVTNAVDSGLVGASDAEQLAFATRQNRVLFSYNIGDFAALHANILSRGERHGGILLAPQQRYSVGEQLRRVIRLQEAFEPGAMNKRLEYLSGWG